MIKILYLGLLFKFAFLSFSASAEYLFCISQEDAKNDKWGNWHWANITQNEKKALSQKPISIINNWIYLNSTPSIYFSSNSGYVSIPNEPETLNYNFNSLDKAKDFCKVLRDICKKNSNDLNFYYVGQSISSLSQWRSINVKYLSELGEPKKHTCPNWNTNNE
ncbi:hypothetical protein [Fluviispira multicolorata]|uniref:Uncharacterized protein n=1 Tax=Fluviispira multicolorata TaxID=2654512 RepID=A0A833JGC2_9BACT|nr:hypothetical protein [Fluviispira multicolorata]KAB8032066.1 hypothetical protein GCL57_05305 [Fluviispira multicolorata]